MRRSRTEDITLEIGERIVVHTPDRRRYEGFLVELHLEGVRPEAVVRLDTGWITTYPLEMVRSAAEDQRLL